MSFKDVLVQLSSYPERTPAAPMEHAVRFAEALGARLSALTFKIEIPNVGNVLANTLLDVSGMVAAERQKSAANVKLLIGEIESLASKRRVAFESIVDSCTTSQLATVVTEHARLHDITIIPIGEQATLQHYVAECVVFGSGRPTLLIPQESNRRKPTSFDVVGVAWDFSRPAARAIADALPILTRAKSVRVVTVTQEKRIDTRRSRADLSRHLACHGIRAIMEEDEAAGRTIGEALEHYATAHDLDLLVMGAYGHSRIRDFVLGGATKTIVASPPLPVLLSH